ncbi:hypothetical protein B0H11DRAFT_2292211 [Mycena galericulata]|nr:hypothetical protein B0H11DRAFT_2292211 [Mycena galericulata]
MSFSAGGTPKKILRARAEVWFWARAGPKSRGAEHAVRAKLVDGIKLAKSRAARPKKACLRGGVKCLRGGNKCASGPPYEPVRDLHVLRPTTLLPALKTLARQSRPPQRLTLPALPLLPTAPGIRPRATLQFCVTLNQPVSS